MADKKRTDVQHDKGKQKVQADGGKKTTTLPKLINWEELDGNSAGIVCDVTTGQCTD